MEHTAERRPPVGAIVAIAGGVLLAIGSFLPWAEVSGGGVSVSAKGTDGSDGWITLAAGVVAIAAGIAAIRGARRALAVLMILAGVVGGGVGVYDAISAEDSAKDAVAEEAAAQGDLSAGEARGLLDELIAAGQLDLEVSISFGLYVVIGGGVLGLVGGVMSLGRRQETGTMPRPSAAAPAAERPAPGVPAAPLREDTPEPAPPAMPPSAPPSPPSPPEP
jgi:hypothetical protein